MKNLDLESLKNKKIALVLSGGVVKAASWHLGVAQALEEMGLNFKNNQSLPDQDYQISTYVGSSAGSLVGLYFAAGFGPEEIIRSNIRRERGGLRSLSYKDIFNFKRPLARPPKTSFYDPLEGLPTYLKGMFRPFLSMTGPFSTLGLQKFIDKHLIDSNSFEDLSADLFVVATQLDHSRKVIFSKYNFPTPGHDSTAVYYTDHPVSECVAASMSVPPFFAPYPLKNPKTKHIDYYIDGEIRETLSTHVAADNGCEVIISSWTHTPYHYHEEVGSLINFGLPAIAIQAIHLLIEKKIVESRAKKSTAKDIIDTVSLYMKDHKIGHTHRHAILAILEKKLNYKKNILYIDIYPKHENYKIFLSNSFSLNPKVTSEIVEMGRLRTHEVFKNQECFLNL